MVNITTYIILAFAALVLSIVQISCNKFSINYEADSFYMNGKPFRYISGSMHYFRIPKEYWKDRLRKIRAAGLNAISTYVEWSLHEPLPGVWDFSGGSNITEFLEAAKAEGLYVILRPGPYICAERDMGGLPYWLLTRNPKINLRTSDLSYTRYVERWLDKLMTMVSPYLYGKGGPIILVQVENEYGSYFACDFKYLYWLRDLFMKYVSDNAVLFTTDGASKEFLKCGKIHGVYATVDFGSGVDVRAAFQAQRIYEPNGPLVNSEYYSGWLSHWGYAMAKKNTTEIVLGLKKILDAGANVNIYMFHGGTNFGFTSGANFDGSYSSQITSYDYDAPISEAGDLTEKYFAIKNLVQKYLPPPQNISVNISNKGRGKIPTFHDVSFANDLSCNVKGELVHFLGEYGEYNLMAFARMLSPRVKQMMGRTFHYRTPVSFEALNQDHGYLIYETLITKNLTLAQLYVPVVHDIGHVYLNTVYQGTLSREFTVDKMPLYVRDGDVLAIVVENLGRINYGSYINDSKGILSDVDLNGETLTSWNVTTFDLRNIDLIEDCNSAENFEMGCMSGGGFTFYVANFAIPSGDSNLENYPLDSFLDVSNLKKGVVFLNEHNLGRYWSSRGPQYSLYVPGVYFKPFPAVNKIVIVEEVIFSPSIYVKFIKSPILIENYEPFL